jgi:hypothetical protein
MYEFVLLLGASGTDTIEWPGKGDGGIFIDSFEIGDGSRAVVGYRLGPLLKPDMPFQITPQYFKGATEADMLSGNVAGLVIGQDPNGPAKFYDSPLDVKRNNPGLDSRK